MAITIKELLASDTISQAADKVNFNFDQLLLNGGGPAGLQGPQGPPGPVGGRGIRGSQWYEGVVDPNTVIFPDLEENDSYLQSNGDVWEYNGTAWVLTGINLEGPAGPAGASIWGETGNPTVGGQQITYPTTYPGDIVRTVLVGAVPTTDAVANPQFHVSIPLTNQLQITNTALAIQVPSGAQSAIRFFGSQAAGVNYTQNVFDAQRIDLFDGDMLQFNDQKNPDDATQTLGYLFRTFERGIQQDVGRGYLLTTGLSAFAGTPLNTSSDIVMRVAADPIGAISPGEIFLQVQTGPQNAGFKVGTLDAVLSGAPLTGNIWGEAAQIRLFADATSGGAGLILLDGNGPVGFTLSASNGSGQVLTVNELDIQSTAGAIDIDAFGDIDVTSANGDLTLESLTGETKLIGDDLVQVATTAFAGANNGALMWHNVGAGGNVLWRTNTPQGAAPAGFTGPFPGGYQAVFNVWGQDNLAQGDACMTVGAGMYPGSGVIHGSIRNSMQVQRTIIISEDLNEVGSAFSKLTINNITGTDDIDRMIHMEIAADPYQQPKGSTRWVLLENDATAGIGFDWGRGFGAGYTANFDDIDNTSGSGSGSGRRVGFQTLYKDANRQYTGGIRTTAGFYANVLTNMGNEAHKNIAFEGYQQRATAADLGGIYGLYLNNDIGANSQPPERSTNWLKTGIQVGHSLSSLSGRQLGLKLNIIQSPTLIDDTDPLLATALYLGPRASNTQDARSAPVASAGSAGGIGFSFITSVDDGYYNPAVNRQQGLSAERSGLLLWSSDFKGDGSANPNMEHYGFCIGPHVDTNTGTGTVLGQNWKGEVRVNQTGSAGGNLLAQGPGGGVPTAGSRQAFSVCGGSGGSYAATIQHPRNDGFGLFVLGGLQNNDPICKFVDGTNWPAGPYPDYVELDANDIGAGSWNFVSDKRLKKDFKPATEETGLSAILRLKPTWFKKKMDKTQTPRLGLLAQELEEVLPHIVRESKEEIEFEGEKIKPKTIGPSLLVYPLIQAVQELSKENDELKARLEAIEKKLGI